MLTLPASTLARYRRFSLYNSPYPAHDRGRAIDLYPSGSAGISPVAGEVVDTRTVRAPTRAYAAAHDHLIVVRVDAAASDVETDADLLARVLHVDPAVEPGDSVAVGDPLGSMVRSGFFARWVDEHVHLGFRPADRDPYRAAGSLSLAVATRVTPLPWDGVGTVRETGPTHALLDAPTLPDAGGSARVSSGFAALAADDGTPLDGGFPHYAGGGTFGEHGTAPRDLSVLGTTVGRLSGRDVTWADVGVFANGRRLTGLSLFAARESFGVKLVCPDHDFEAGDRVRVAVRPVEDSSEPG